MIEIGEWQLQTLVVGRFWLDAGIMYGVVPKMVWQTLTPADAQNRIPFVIRCVVARRGSRVVLIDTGHGDKLSPLDRSAHAIEPWPTLIESLAGVGVAADEVTDVVLSHLHWDHAGGATRTTSDGTIVSTFPSASYHVNRLEWEDATSGVAELAGSYAEENFSLLRTTGQLVLADGDRELFTGLWTRVTGGHTRGHQAIVFESHGQGAMYLGDLCPAVTHLRRFWCAAYDLFPLETRIRKPQLLGEIADRGWWVLWDHEPSMAACRLERHSKKEFVATSPCREL